MSTSNSKSNFKKYKDNPESLAKINRMEKEEQKRIWKLIDKVSKKS